MILWVLTWFSLLKGRPACVSPAHSKQHSPLWLLLPQAASLGLPGRSKSWGRGCRRVGIYTSGSGMGSPRRTGTWAQKRKRHKSENLGEPKIEVLNSRF